MPFLKTPFALAALKKGTDRFDRDGVQADQRRTPGDMARPLHVLDADQAHVLGMRRMGGRK